MVEKIRKQGRRLADLIEKLLDFGTIGPGRLHLVRESIDLADVVRAAVDRAQEEVSRSGSSLTLDLHSARGSWDRVRIEQVIGNLLTNAVKYGLARPIRVAVDAGLGFASLAVEDEGNGIPEEARERIFRPFERMADTVGVPGIGMGLYVCAEIVKAHGGRIFAQARPGRGSRFVVELPLGDDASSGCERRGCRSARLSSMTSSSKDSSSRRASRAADVRATVSRHPAAVSS